MNRRVPNRSAIARLLRWVLVWMLLCLVLWHDAQWIRFHSAYVLVAIIGTGMWARLTALPERASDNALARAFAVTHPDSLPRSRLLDREARSFDHSPRQHRDGGGVPTHPFTDR